MYIPNFLRPYWMLKLTSILLKLAAVVMLVLFCGQLFQSIMLKINGATVANGTIPGDSLVPTNVLIDFVIRSVVIIVGAYAGGQLIDLFLSMELSLKTLANRRRQPQTTEVNREE